MLRKLLSGFVVLASVGAVVLGIGGTAAYADTVGCSWTSNGLYYCRVLQTTDAGWADATTDYFPSTGYSLVEIHNEFSGYTMKGWAERRYNGGPVSTVWGPVNSPNGSVQSTEVYDRGAYQVRACFQFTSWSGAAIHCTPWF